MSKEIIDLLGGIFLLSGCSQQVIPVGERFSLEKEDVMKVCLPEDLELVKYCKGFHKEGGQILFGLNPLPIDSPKQFQHIGGHY